MIPYVEPLFRPPSEARSLIFQITLGCSRNRCRFCGMYAEKPFRVKPLPEVLAEIGAIPLRYRAMVDRVFLADGDALIYPFEGLCRILETLAHTFPRLARVAAYASPGALAGKSPDELLRLRQLKLRLLYLGLESGDDATLAAVDKGADSGEILRQALKAREAGMKLSVTAILGLAGRSRSLDHARATAAWVNAANPEYFSLLTLFQRHNHPFLQSLEQCSHRQLLLEALELVRQLSPARTVLRSNHVSNFLTLEGSYPKDRQRIIAQVEAALAAAERMPAWLDQVPDYCEEYY